jgi:hypothetical protein
MASVGSDSPAQPDVNVTDLLKNLNLTAEEEEVLAFDDDEAGDANPTVEWAILGKVLSPATVHAQAIQGAMKPA